MQNTDFGQKVEDLAIADCPELTTATGLENSQMIRYLRIVNCPKLQGTGNLATTLPRLDTLNLIGPLGDEINGDMTFGEKMIYLELINCKSTGNIDVSNCENLKELQYYHGTKSCSGAIIGDLSTKKELEILKLSAGITYTGEGELSCTPEIVPAPATP